MSAPARSCFAYRGHSEIIDAAIILPGGSRAISTSESELKLWDLDRRSELFIVHGQFECEDGISAGPFTVGTMVLQQRSLMLYRPFEGDDLEVRCLESGRLRCRLKGSADIRVLSVAPGECWLVGGRTDRWLQIWDLDTGQILRSLHAGPAFDGQRNDDLLGQLLIAPDMRSLATRSHDGVIRIWHLPTATEQESAVVVPAQRLKWDRPIQLPDGMWEAMTRRRSKSQQSESSWTVRDEGADRCLPSHWRNRYLGQTRQRRRRRFLAVECGGRALGFAVYEHHEHVIRLVDVRVVPPRRRQGLGTAMIRALQNKLPSSRRSRITVKVPERALEAQLFLQAMGFRAVRVNRGALDNGDDSYTMVYRCPCSERNRLQHLDQDS